MKVGKIVSLFLVLLFTLSTWAGTATFVGKDQSNQGSVFTHGATGELIPLLDTDVLGPQTSVTITYADIWLWAWQANDPRSIFVRDLIQPNAPIPGPYINANGGLAACWFGDEFYISVTNNGNILQPQQIGLYLVDWDHLQREERIDVIDQISGNLLDSETVTGFDSGVYLNWNVTGTVVFHVTNLGGGPNAVVSGVFVDPVTRY
jgi:hypothetical protein